MTDGDLVIMQLLYEECACDIGFEKVESSNMQSLPYTWTEGVEEFYSSVDEVNREFMLAVYDVNG